MEEKDIIGGRVHNSFFEDDLNNIHHEVGDDLITRFGEQINVYKFRKTSGITRITNLGERNTSYSNKQFRQTTNVYNGKSPITVVWDDSTKLVVNEQDEIVKEVKVGTYYKMYFNTPNNNQLVVDNITILNKDYVNSYINRDITLTSFDWDPNDDDILDCVYLIFDKRNKSLQWLEINNTQPYYHENTKKFIQCEITFENVNLKYSRTGKTLIDFIQLGAISEGYCFPKEDENGNVSLDEEKLIRENEGTNQIQFDFNGGVGNSSFIFWGRRKEKMVDGKIILDKPHILLPYRINFPKRGEFFYNQPNSNSYAVINALPTKQGIWSSYKESFKANDRIGEYNVDKNKQVLTGFSIDLAKTRQTNIDLSTYINWDNKNSVEIDLQVSLEAIAYLDPKVKRIWRKIDYSTFFVINSFLNWSSDVFNYDYRETVKYKAYEVFGIFGGLINFVLNGIDFGWTSSNSLGPKQPMNFLVPCISFEDGKAALSEVAPLPTDIFIDENEKKILPTATNVLTSWNITLTDAFIDNQLILSDKPVGKGGNGIWYTKYLGQTKDEEGNWLLPTRTPLLLNLQTFSPYRIPEEAPNYIIDYVDFKAVGQCDYRISAYNSLGQNVYSSYQETLAKARDEITLWGNTIKFNYYDDFNTQGQASWPELINPPKPNVDSIKFILKDSVNKQMFPTSIFEGGQLNNSPFNLYFDNITSRFSGKLITKFNSNFESAIPGQGPIYEYSVSRTFEPLSGENNVYYQEPNNERIVIKNPIPYNVSFKNEISDITKFSSMEIELWNGVKEIVEMDHNTKTAKTKFKILDTNKTMVSENKVWDIITTYGQVKTIYTTIERKNLNVLLEDLEFDLSFSWDDERITINNKINTSKIVLLEVNSTSSSTTVSLPITQTKEQKQGTLKNPLEGWRIKQISLIPILKK